jgi:type VI secretion system secreted protein VgrG
MEVLVSFIDGNPDRPIVIGTVFNGENLPPYAVNGEKYGTTIKSVRNNELRFDDVRGEEQVCLHAERNLDVVAENDRTLRVGRDEVIEVGNDQLSIVGRNQTVTIGNHYHKAVRRKQSRARPHIFIRVTLTTSSTRVDLSVPRVATKCQLRDSWR